jgi:hypothetical protein
MVQMPLRMALLFLLARLIHVHLELQSAVRRN